MPFLLKSNPRHSADAVKSYLERKTADKTLLKQLIKHSPPQVSTESRPEYYRGSVRSPGQRKKQPKCKEELWEVQEETYYNISEDYSRKHQDSLPK